MDSKNIYISTQTFKKKVSWLANGTDSEWNFIGNDLIKLKLLIDSFFEKEQRFYFVTDRHHSSEEEKIKIYEYSSLLIEKQDFSIWNRQFNKVIEFNKIGVYRIGNYNQNSILNRID